MLGLSIYDYLWNLVQVLVINKSWSFNTVVYIDPPSILQYILKNIYIK